MTQKSIKYQVLEVTQETSEVETTGNNLRERHDEKLPPGICFLQKTLGRKLSYATHKHLVLFLTFVIYTCYHASRRPLNVVKPILSPYETISHVGKTCSEEDAQSEEKQAIDGAGWIPFSGKQGEERLVALDFAFLLSYAVGVFISGRLADRSNLRHFLFWGMLGSGLSVLFFGLGYFLNIHSFGFYFILQICIGLFQATGWPAVVAVVAQWFGKENLGLVMGIWNAHASCGNSIGSALSGSVLKYGWGSAFLLLGSLIAFIGGLFWFFLIPHPSDAGFASSQKVRTSEETPEDVHHQESVSWWAAFMIPGVIPFSVALFFSKFVAYTFLFWLPYYISSICINGDRLSVSEAGDFTILFDIGGILGGIFAGWCFDRTRAGALVSSVFNAVSIPIMLTYNHLGRQSIPMNLFLLGICGFCVNGPFALITTAISADLGTHESLQGNTRALSTVTAIIDGMGSLGAALGPTLTGQIVALSSKASFSHVFFMLSISSFISILVLCRVSFKELTSSKTLEREVCLETDKLVNKSNLM